jgi:hypothetical protein
MAALEDKDTDVVTIKRVNESIKILISGRARNMVARFHWAFF